MSRRPLAPGALRQALRRHGVRPTRALGQNFVTDPNTIRKIVRIADVQPDDTVLEIGPGAGALTVELCQVAKEVVAVEVDGGLVALLEESLGATQNVKLVHADALRADLAALGANRLVANLPYNLAAPLVVKVLEEVPAMRDLTVMTQKEVGDRLAAPPGSKVYGQVSVIVAYYATARVAMRVSRRAFYPQPHVDSVVVRIVRRAEPPRVDHASLFEVVRAAFAQRRKTLRNSLASVAGSVELAEEVLARAGVDPRTRPEQLGLEGFVALSSALERGPGGAATSS